MTGVVPFAHRAARFAEELCTLFAFEDVALCAKRMFSSALFVCAVFYYLARRFAGEVGGLAFHDWVVVGAMDLWSC